MVWILKHPIQSTVFLGAAPFYFKIIILIINIRPNLIF